MLKIYAIISQAHIKLINQKRRAKWLLLIMKNIQI